MAQWGAINVNSDDAAREVLEHTVVASIAYVSHRYHESSETLAVAWLVPAASPSAGAAEFGDDPESCLRRMAAIEAALRAAGAGPHWHGAGNLVWAMDATSVTEAAEALAKVVTTVSSQGIVLRAGVAHGTEAKDPVDLLRLAAHRSARDTDEPAWPDMRSVEVPLSEAERTRLALIAENRGRSTDTLVREALDLLRARYRTP
jgi:hypothetical protein